MQKLKRVLRIEKEVYGDGTEGFYVNEYKEKIPGVFDAVDCHGGGGNFDAAKEELDRISERLKRQQVLKTEVLYEEEI